MSVGRATLRGVCLLAICLAALTTSGCSESYSWNQKLTIEVETPSGMKIGSAVTRLNMWVECCVPGLGTVGNSSIHGEATVVELAPGRYLFAILRGHEDLAQNVFRETIGLSRKSNRPEFNVWAKRLENLRATANVPANAYPEFVTFSNVSDPASVKRVDPHDLSAAFGPGYRLKRITLEITDEGKSTTLKSVLPWITYGVDVELVPVSDPDNRSIASMYTRGDFLRR